MTTPERIRRRQRIEAALLVLLGIGLVLQNRYFAHQNAVQNNCLADQFGRLTNTLNARGNLATRDADATKKMILGVTTAKTPADFQRLLSTYQRAVAETAAERKAHPFPPFPNGTCQ